MQVSDIMTPKVFSVEAGTGVGDIAELLMKKKISAVPVLEENGKLLGIVSEGDLMRRLAADADQEEPWWMLKLASPEREARDFIKAHGRTAKDIMTRNVVTLTEDMDLAAVAQLLESNRIKRAPVLRDGKVVGIVSRSNLLQAVAAERSGTNGEARLSDREIRNLVHDTLSSKEFASHGALNVIVEDGVVELWGWVESDAEREALLLAAGEIEGVKQVKDHFGRVSPWIWGT